MFAALKDEFWRFLSSLSDSVPVDRGRGSRERQRDVSMDDEVDNADNAAASNSRERFRADETRLQSAGRSPGEVPADASESIALPLAQPAREQTTFRSLEQSEEGRSSDDASRPSLSSVERVTHGGHIGLNSNVGLGRSLNATAANPSRRTAWPLARERPAFREQSRNSRPSSPALRSSLLSAERVEQRGASQNHNDGIRRSLFTRPGVPLAQPSHKMELLQLVEWCRRYRPSDRIFVLGASQLSGERVEHREPVQNRNDGLENSRSATAADPSSRPALPLPHCSGEQTSLRPLEPSQDIRSSGRASRPSMLSLERGEHGEPVQNPNEGSENSRSATAAGLSQIRALPQAQPPRGQTTFRPHEQSGDSGRSGRASRPFLFSVDVMGRGGPIQNHNEYGLPRLERALVVQPERSLCRTPGHNLASSTEANGALSVCSGRSMTAAQNTRIRPQEEHTYQSLLPQQGATFNAEACRLSKEQSYESQNTHPVPEISVPSVATFPKLTAEMEAPVDDASRPDAHGEMIAFPQLTAEMEAVVSAAFRPGAPDEVMVTGFGLSITRKDLKTLKDLRCLNDEVINFYMSMLVERSRTQATLPSVYAFHTFFYPKLRAKGYGAVKHWTSRVDIFAHDLLLVPVLLDLHWCLAVIDLRHRAINYYDPVGNKDYECSETLCDYLEEESRNKRQEQLDLSDWTLDSVKDIPYQHNFSDCGIFVLKCAEHITRDAKLTFSQLFMPYFRRCAVYEIVTKKLL